MVWCLIKHTYNFNFNFTIDGVFGLYGPVQSLQGFSVTKQT
jgi:hypothetical protein